MDIFQAFFLGIIQGLTEFLPLSSSGHLVIFQRFFQFQNPPVFFDIFLHFATLTAVVFFFKDFIKNLSFQDLKIIFIGNIPTGIIGLFLNSYQITIFSSLYIVSFGFLITSLFLIFSKKLAPKSKIKLKVKDGLIIGLTQGLSILPGISRSAVTIVTALLLGQKPEKAFSFSFLFSLPAITAALVLQTVKTDFSALPSLSISSAGFVAALITGLFSLHLLKKILKTKFFYRFSYYTLPLSLITFLLA